MLPEAAAHVLNSAPLSAATVRPLAAIPTEEFCDDVCAVVVTFHPDVDDLRDLLTTLRTQVGRIVIVDNGSSADVAQALPTGDEPNMYLIRNDENLGIAAAQNLGAARAMAWDACRYVLFFDQDSLPAPGMVRRLRDALRVPYIASSGLNGETAGMPSRGVPGKVAAVGAWSIDIRTGVRSVLVVDPRGWPMRWLPSLRPVRAGLPANAPYEVSFLISSGTLVPCSALLALRGMRSNYFIDHVDTEWCLRARVAGYLLLVVPEARLYHRLGDSVRRIWFFGSRQIFYHSPLRDYYMFRNTLLMLKDVPLSAPWKFHLLFRLVLFGIYFLVLGDARSARLRLIMLGLKHGLLRRSGRLRPGTVLCDAVRTTSLDPGAQDPATAPVAGAKPSQPGQ